MFLRHAFLTGVAAVIAAGQSVTWSPPVLGYFYDAPSSSIRVVAGVPGAASIDSSVPSAAKLRDAFIAPSGKFAIAQTIDEGSVLLDWSAGAVTARELPSVAAEVSAVVFSSRGAEAAVVSKTAGKVQIWRGLPGNPSIAREIALSAETLALSDDGNLAWIESEGVYTLEGDTPKLLAAGTFSALAFRPGTRALAAAAKYNDAVLSIRSADGQAASTTMASSEDGIAEPAGLQFSADGKRLVVANSRGRSATVLNVEAGTSLTINCDCNPGIVSSAAGNAVFRITASTDEPIAYIDADSPEPRIFQVPVSGVSR
jgi:hypothetical protein